MTGARRAPKILSVFIIVLGALYLVMGGIVVVGAQQLAGTPVAVGDMTVDMALYASTAGWWSVVVGVVTLLMGLLGLRAANTRKVGLFRALALIGLVMNLIGIGANVTTGQLTAIAPGDIVMTLVSLFAFVLAVKVGNEPPTGVETLRH